MTEHDTDIDFDFFEDEPPTQESSRTERLIPRRGPRGPQRPPRGPTNLTPLLRLVGLIAFAILIVVLLVFWVQSCQASSKEKTYKSYMTKVSEVAGSSQQIGKQLNQVLLAQGQKEAQLEQKVTGLARQEQGREHERGGRDQELDEKQVGDGVVDAGAAGAEGDLRPVGENLVEDEQRSACTDRRAGCGGCGGRLRAGGRLDAYGDSLEREAR